MLTADRIARIKGPATNSNSDQNFQNNANLDHIKMSTIRSSSSFSSPSSESPSKPLLSYVSTATVPAIVPATVLAQPEASVITLKAILEAEPLAVVYAKNCRWSWTLFFQLVANLTISSMQLEVGIWFSLGWFWGLLTALASVLIALAFHLFVSISARNQTIDDVNLANSVQTLKNVAIEVVGDGDRHSQRCKRHLLGVDSVRVKVLMALSRIYKACLNNARMKQAIVELKDQNEVNGLTAFFITIRQAHKSVDDALALETQTVVISPNLSGSGLVGMESSKPGCQLQIAHPDLYALEELWTYMTINLEDHKITNELEKKQEQSAWELYEKWIVKHPDFPDSKTEFLERPFFDAIRDQILGLDWACLHDELKKGYRMLPNAKGFSNLCTLMESHSRMLRDTQYHKDDEVLKVLVGRKLPPRFRADLRDCEVAENLPYAEWKKQSRTVERRRPPGPAVVCAR
ncbi:hypothetical protein BT96DRAFT_1059413 [Gymnopus androsaceus JB14]|uniref:Uncharacterized protein n=1 Tax=Gymnopus androsaceus JB14 TaxID=1447944 RepID=A0A6A4IAB4_9AGAR|nr:hypothetical protein BT96DRAFT_1059413 [Gymnopus androsaceus JB14]